MSNRVQSEEVEIQDPLPSIDRQCPRQFISRLHNGRVMPEWDAGAPLSRFQRGCSVNVGDPPWVLTKCRRTVGGPPRIGPGPPRTASFLPWIGGATLDLRWIRAGPRWIGAHPPPQEGVGTSVLGKDKLARQHVRPQGPEGKDEKPQHLGGVGQVHPEERENGTWGLVEVSAHNPLAHGPGELCPRPGDVSDDAHRPEGVAGLQVGAEREDGKAARGRRARQELRREPGEAPLPVVLGEAPTDQLGSDPFELRQALLPNRVQRGTELQVVEDAREANPRVDKADPM